MLTLLLISQIISTIDTSISHRLAQTSQDIVSIKSLFLLTIQLLPRNTKIFAIKSAGNQQEKIHCSNCRCKVSAPKREFALQLHGDYPLIYDPGWPRTDLS